MNWSLYDFLLMGGMLAAGIVSTLVLLGASQSWQYRLGAFLSMIGALLLVWVTGAVGIIGAPAHVGNLLLLSVIPVGIIGALLFRFRARGIAITLTVMAILQFAVAGLAIMSGWGAEAARWPWAVLLGNAFFSGLWVGSASLFASAARRSV